MFSCLLALEQLCDSSIMQQGGKKWTHHNNHTLPQTALLGPLFSKSGYTQVGSAEYSIDIYRK